MVHVHIFIGLFYFEHFKEKCLRWAAIWLDIYLEMLMMFQVNYDWYLSVNFDCLYKSIIQNLHLH